MEAETLEFFAGAGELALATVDDDKVREPDKGARPCGPGLVFEASQSVAGRFLGSVGIVGPGSIPCFKEDPLVAAADHLRHGSEVVLALDRADAVAAVG